MVISYEIVEGHNSAM